MKNVGEGVRNRWSGVRNGGRGSAVGLLGLLG